MQTSSDAIRFNGAVTLSSNVVLDTDNADGTDTAGGTITLTNDAPINSASNEHNNFTLDAGTAAITFNATIGGAACGPENLGDFSITEADAGLVFVGPTPQMITAMGSKWGSKALMEKAGVPLVPSEAEVASVFEVPLDHLLDPAQQVEASAEWRGQTRHFYEIRWQDRRIWGATAAMLVNLSRQLAWA